MKNTFLGFFLLVLAVPSLWFLLHPKDQTLQGADSSESEMVPTGINVETLESSHWKTFSDLMGSPLSSFDSIKLDQAFKNQSLKTRRDSLLCGFYEIARASKNEGLFLQSRSFYEKALSIDVDFNCEKRQELGEVYLKLGYPEKAFKLNETCLQKTSVRSTLFWGANLYFAMGKLKESRQMLGQIENQEDLREDEIQLLADLRKKLNDNKLLLLE